MRTNMMQVRTPARRQASGFHRHHGTTTPVTYSEAHVPVGKKLSTVESSIHGILDLAKSWNCVTRARYRYLDPKILESCTGTNLYTIDEYLGAGQGRYCRYMPQNSQS